MNKTIPKPSSDLLVEIRSAWTFFGTSEFEKVLRQIGNLPKSDKETTEDSEIYELVGQILQKKQNAEFIYFLKEHKKSAKVNVRSISDEDFSLLLSTASAHFGIPESQIINSGKAHNPFTAYLCVIVILKYNFNIKNEEIALKFKKSSPTIYNHIQVFLDLDKRNPKDREILESITSIKQKLNLATT